jgi:acyl-coenzyme A thioesterase PaaI-like protein
MFIAESVEAQMTTNEEHYRTLEKMYASAPCNGYYAPEIHVSHGNAEVVIPVQPKFFHAAGATHGSVYFKALDDAAFFAVSSLVTDVFALTVSFISTSYDPFRRVR